MKLSFPILAGFLLGLSGTMEMPAQEVPDSSLIQWKTIYSRAYGSDYQLINGIKYLKIPPIAEGHPYLGSDAFSVSRLVLNRRLYNNAEIKYDICNQQIILRARPFSGVEEQIVLVNENVREFQLEGKTFRPFRFDHESPRIYQVIAGDSISCLYYWQKALVKGGVGDYYYKYLPETRKSYLLMDNELHRFRNRKTFIRVFPDEHQGAIRKYLRTNSINISRAGDSSMELLMTFCNNLLMQ